MNRNICLVIIGLVTAVLGLIVPGCDELITEVTEVTIAGHPTAEFGISTDSGCIPLDVRFKDMSSGPHDSLFWWFGDGDSIFGDTNDTVVEPTHTYDSAGIYHVTFTIKNSADSGIDTETKKRAIIAGTSIKDFSADTTEGCQGLEVTFTPVEYGAVDSFRWDFGDGTAWSTDTTPTHIYDSSGYFNVTLTAWGNCGTKVITNDSMIHIGECPEVAFSAIPREGCVPLTVVFRDSSDAGPNHAMQSWYWTLGDVATSDSQDTTITFTVAGVYICSLTATSDGGTAVAVDTITAYATTDANFIAESPTEGCHLPSRQFQVKFKSESTGALDSLLWFFGDGTSLANDSNPVHAYTSPGVYDCTLQVWGACGEATVVQAGFVTLSDTLYTVSFGIGPTTGDTTTEFAFDDASPGVILNWSWNFGDDSTATGPTATHKYADTGHYPVTLLISNGCGTAAAVDTVIVTEGP
ncbi:MAG: PKD domain-containing protein [bacterium]